MTERRTHNRSAGWLLIGATALVIAITSFGPAVRPSAASDGAVQHGAGAMLLAVERSPVREQRVREETAGEQRAKDVLLDPDKYSTTTQILALIVVGTGVLALVARLLG